MKTTIDKTKKTDFLTAVTAAMAATVSSSAPARRSGSSGRHLVNSCSSNIGLMMIISKIAAKPTA